MIIIIRLYIIDFYIINLIHFLVKIRVTIINEATKI